MLSSRIFPFAAAVLLSAAPALAQQRSHLELDSPHASFVEEDFPFFSQTVDAREFGEAPQKDNLTPRGLVFPLSNGVVACFDTDLLRWSLIWKRNDQGEYLTMDGMGPGSYRLPSFKAPAGQESLPRPIGTPLAASGLHPGWNAGPKPVTIDPRERGDADEGEVGLGPLPAEMGRWEGVRLVAGGAQLEYTIAGTKVIERILPVGADGAVRQLEVGPRKKTLWLHLGKSAKGVQVLHNGKPVKASAVSLPPSGKATRHDMVFTEGSAKAGEFPTSQPEKSTPPPRRWKTTLTTRTRRASEDDEARNAYVYDEIPLPVENPWKRNVRLSGLEFFPDGRAAFITFDGDVWIASPQAGSEKSKKETWTWQRFASGLHEPMGLALVDGLVHVFGRNGITRLHDEDGNGEADFHENFSNIVPQTAETREFAMDMVAARGGGFYLAKGGQVGSTRGIANGTVVKVAPDGQSYEVISTGLRQPYFGYDAERDFLTSSDQQGHWKPATPIYRIEKGRYFGFQPAKLKDKAVHPAPIDRPEVWIPHFINASGASQVWIGEGDRMGALNGSLVHLGFNRPELFKIYLDEKRKQGAVVSVLSGFPTGLLRGRVNPADGLLHLCGFKIWGTSGLETSGFFRVRPGGGENWIPERIEAGARGVLLRFPRELDPALSSQPAGYSVDRWNYQQTHNYGSGNFKLDGSPGQESLPVSSVTLSEDRRSVFLGIAGMRPSHSLRVTYRLPVAGAGGLPRIGHAFLTVHGLEEIDLEKAGFGKVEIDLTVTEDMIKQEAAVEPTAELGQQIATQYGCLACHAAGDHVPPTTAEGGAETVVGPPWNRLWRSRREFSDGSFVKAVDETYLRESILDPPRRVAEGFEIEKTGVGMPSYLGVLKDHEIDSLILYIKSLHKVNPKGTKGKGKGKK